MGSASASMEGERAQMEEDVVQEPEGFVQQGGLNRALRKHHITGSSLPT